MPHQFLTFSPEVAHALAHQQPVVALESTIISHGMPYPQNVQTAREVEAEVRAQGAVPATIAIYQGRCHVGLSDEMIEALGQAQGVWKVSLRDMPYVMAQGLWGATTVAATMRIAYWAGIQIFATGGIGGVHRGAESSMDISADLTEMGQTSVAIVSAGVKSILDIGLTLEYLETLGVPVITYGQSTFPSFYSSESAFQSPMRLDSPTDIARLLRYKWDMHLEGSVLIANPLPPAFEMPYEKVEAHIQAALQAAEVQGIRGKDVTPFILKTVAEQSGGESLAANIALIKNNARLAAQIARAYS